MHDRGLDSAEKQENGGFGPFGEGTSGEESYGDLSKYSNLGIKRVKCFKRSEGGCPFESEFSSEETWFSSTQSFCLERVLSPPRGDLPKSQ